MIRIESCLAVSRARKLDWVLGVMVGVTLLAEKEETNDKGLKEDTP